MSKEATFFDASCAMPGVTASGRYYGEPQARLTFPDMQTAADFINHGLADNRFTNGSATVGYLTVVREYPTGDCSQYDAFVTQPDEDTGEVGMFIRQYGNHDLPAYAALSEFVVATAQRMAEVE